LLPNLHGRFGHSCIPQRALLAGMLSLLISAL
jgi:hypothetical protein